MRATCVRYRFSPPGTASDTSARAALAQSTSFCTVGAPLTPIAPTISPSTLMGNPPPQAAIRESAGMPAKSDGSSWIKLKKSCVETPNRAVYALFCAISMVGIEVPSIRLKALRLPPSSRIATFSLTPSSLAFATAASTIFCASSEEMLYFFPTFAIGLLHLISIARRSGEPRSLADLVNTVRVEGDVILYLRHRFKWRLISPHCIDGTIPSSRNAVVGSVALVGTIRRVFATHERGHIDIPTGDILDGRIGGLAKRQRIAGVGDNLSADCDHDARRVRIDRNRVVRPRNLHPLVSHDLYPSELETAPRPGAIGLGDEDVAQQQEHASGIGKERMAFLTRDHAAKGRENDPAEGEMVVTIVRSYATQDVRLIVHAL